MREGELQVLLNVSQYVDLIPFLKMAFDILIFQWEYKLSK